MSEENVATVRASLEHFAATDEFLRTLAPDFVWDMSTFVGWLDKPRFHGADGLREFVTIWRSPYDDWSMRLNEVGKIRRIEAYATYAEALQAAGLSR